MEGITTYEEGTGLIIQSDKPLYIFANRDGYDFKYNDKINNHYFNNPQLSRFIVQRNGISVISTVEEIQNKFFTNITVLLNVNLDNVSLINLFRTVTETISTTSWAVGAINKNKLDNQLGNFYNTIFIACKDKAKKPIPFDISLYYEVKEITDEALRESFKLIGYPRNISRYLLDSGVSLNDMEEIVTEYKLQGVIKEDITIDNFKKEFFKVLKDKNIISYLIEIIELEECFSYNKIDELKDIDLSNLNMTNLEARRIANQIDGRDAILIYDEIMDYHSKLLENKSPLIKNIIQGLISGCISILNKQ